MGQSVIKPQEPTTQEPTPIITHLRDKAQIANKKKELALQKEMRARRARKAYEATKKRVALERFIDEYQVKYANEINTAADTILDECNKVADNGHFGLSYELMMSNGTYPPRIINKGDESRKNRAIVCAKDNCAVLLRELQNRGLNYLTRPYYGEGDEFEVEDSRELKITWGDGC